MEVRNTFSPIRLKTIFPTIFRNTERKEQDFSESRKNKLNLYRGVPVAKMELIILIPLGIIQLILNTNRNHYASASTVSDQRLGRVLSGQRVRKRFSGLQQTAGGYLDFPIPNSSHCLATPDFGACIRSV